jgi:hypothetical protein
MTAHTTTTFVSYVAHRAISGGLNGAFYGHLFPIAAIASMALCMLTMYGIAKYIEWSRLKTWAKVMTILTLVGCILSIALTVASFTIPGLWFADVHLWTLMQQVCLAGALYFSGTDIMALLATVYPAVFMQKLFVNLLAGKRWNYRGTNDKTGATYGIPKLGINVPRIASMYIRLGLAIASVTGYILRRRWLRRHPGKDLKVNKMRDRLIYK